MKVAVKNTHLVQMEYEFSASGNNTINKEVKKEDKKEHVDGPLLVIELSSDKVKNEDDESGSDLTVTTLGLYLN